MIKSLTGRKLYCGTNTLNNAYETFIKPIIKYSRSTLKTVSLQTIKKLGKAQNHARRLITGAVKTSLIIHMLLRANIQEMLKCGQKLWHKHWTPREINLLAGSQTHNRTTSTTVKDIKTFIKVLKYKLTNSMAYGTRRFNAAFTRALQ